MKLLVTGGCGFVGINLIARMQELGGHSVRVLDNESLGKREWLAPFDVDFRHGDIRDADTVRNALDGVDAVVHLAAFTRVMDSIADPRVCFDVNVVGTFQLLVNARDLGIPRFVNASTGGAILGEAPPPINETMLPHPLAPYGASKLAGEAFCGAFTGAYGSSTISLRFSNIFGPHSFHKGSIVALVLRSVLRGEPVTIYGDGSQTRDYIFAPDLSDAILTAAEGRPTGVYQLGAGRPTTLNELLDLIDEVVGPDHKVERIYADFRPGEVRHTYTDISKAKRELKYNPQTDLLDGLHTTWRWFRQNADYFGAKV